MRVIGITGGIGTGKSTLLHLLKEEYGAYIIEADSLAHKLMMPGEEAYKEIVDTFDREILLPDGNIDRTVLGGLVFKDERALSNLNRIVHPAVKKWILEDIAKKRLKGAVQLYVIEAALLIEDGYEEICDELWYIHTDIEERIRRLLASRGGNVEKWNNIIANQSPESYYREHCAVIIDNGNNWEKTENIVKELLSKSI